MEGFGARGIFAMDQEQKLIFGAGVGDVSTVEKGSLR